MTAAPSAVVGDSRHRMLRGARFALHLITVVLTVVVTVRAALAGGELVLVLCAAGAFLAWYGAGASFARGRAAGWWVVALAVLWAGMVVLSPEFVWLVFPILLLAGHVLRQPWSLLFAAAAIAAAIVVPAVHPASAGLTTFAHILGPLVGGGFAYGVSLGYDRLLRDAAERERLIASLIRAQEETARLQEELAVTQREAGAARERTRLARDLHDTIAQELSSIVMLARADDEAGSSSGTGSAGQVAALAQHALGELRRIVAALAPAELEGSALAAALSRMVAALGEETGISARLDVDETLPPLPTAVEVAFLRLAQSALSNVRRHAGASHVRVVLAADAGGVVLEVVDDGVGFDVDEALRRSGSSYGFTAMRSRLRELGGELRIASEPGEGVRLAASVPLAPGGTATGEHA
ncbi:sensor histidine kinase [Microbacterium resistens]